MTQKQLSPEQYQELKDVIIKANPEIMERKFEDDTCLFYIEDEIRLCDVLIANEERYIEKKYLAEGVIEARKKLWEETKELILLWNLLKNSLSEQSPETKLLLYQLLVQNDS